MYIAIAIIAILSIITKKPLTVAKNFYYIFLPPLFLRAKRLLNNENLNFIIFLFVNMYYCALN
jgi:hypothetical protein